MDVLAKNIDCDCECCAQKQFRYDVSFFMLATDLDRRSLVRRTCSAQFR
uniref:Uncharacterized protein n=1 Tax=Arundo donax TaxID=35708 RepID=A0A0A9ATH4_ARUDO